MSSNKPTRVVRGACIFNSPVVKYSKETEQLLRSLITESRLTTLQRQRVLDCVAHGSSLPPPSSGSRSFRPRAASAPSCPTAASKLCARRRSLRDIEQSGAYLPPPLPRLFTVDRTKEIEKFQSLMAHGKQSTSTVQSKEEGDIAKPAKKTEEPDRFQELVADIEDIFNFLEEMRALGKEKHYWPIVQQQIAAKIRQMEKIDRQRSKELKEWIKSHEKNNCCTYREKLTNKS
ncbi:UPF0193 protein EVG1 [Schistocerca gregaria]|uniref:UPF0193 protein EVG1 n=1 Tax=Schistocerca gregaria TaxID=7010 RepID=UPI00211EDB94|nr:UPF0193 protein EVG1 [Schistocerca gregaria]